MEPRPHVVHTRTDNYDGPKPHEDPGDLHGFCGGRDRLLDTCTCPDISYTITFRLITGNTWRRQFLCTCCELPIDPAYLGQSIR